MSKVWLVAWYDYGRNVFKKSFIMAILSLPLMIAFAVAAGWIASTLSEDDRSAGYVDQAGLLADPIPAPRPGSSPSEPSVRGNVPLIPFPTEAAAREALESGEIQVFYVVTADYYETNRVRQVYVEPPDGDVTRQFWDFMQINRLTDLPPEVASRAVSGSDLIVRWPNDVPGGGREFSQRTFFSQFLPLFVGVAFVTLLFVSSGHLMGTVVEEKENRTVEVLMTSISPGKLMAGKIISVVAISLTLLVSWIAFAGLTALIGGQYLGVELLQNLSLDLRIVAKMLVIAAPAYVMIAALMTALGTTVVEAQEAQQMMGVFIIPTMVPVWLIQPIIEHPNSPLSIGLSFFPLTALPTFSLRVAFSQVPLWQIALGAAILALCAVGAVWLAGRAFRLGMLRYGQRLSWRELFNRTRTNADLE